MKLYGHVSLRENTFNYLRVKIKEIDENIYQLKMKKEVFSKLLDMYETGMCKFGMKDSSPALVQP